MSEQPRNWDKELADVDRVIAEQGTGAPPARGGAPARHGEPPARRGGAALTWFWVLLAVGLAVALPLWPYQRTCGLQTIFFLGAAGITALVGGLAAASSWANRRAFAHVVSLLVMAWALVVAASEILPRTGYAKEVRTWTCPDVPAQPAPAQPGPTQAAPVQPSPAPAAPVQPNPAQPAPAQPGPAQPAPAP
ncbi:MAG TPA: hypothetical protein VMN37_06375 [Gemmatimonadales bacterium]|nr:hypothetical protein [Gemmatimonadales bacterium]